MKHELKNEFKSELLLSQFDLSNQDLSDEWFTGFFTNPISKSLNIINKEDGWENSDIYIGFSEIKEVYSSKDKEFFVNLNRKIKKTISEEWGTDNKIKPVYKLFQLKSEDKAFKRYLYIYLTPKRTNKIFDFNQLYTKENAIAAIFEMLMGAYLLEIVNERNPLNIDVCSGKIFLNPVVNEAGDEVDVFEYSFKFEGFNLRFVLKHQVFSLKSGNLDIYDDVCSLIGMKYSDKLDAREKTRLFLDFTNFSKMKKSKFVTQLEFYKDVVAMLDNYGISYSPSTFTPDYLFNEFPTVERNMSKLNIYISKEDKTDYENLLIKKSVPHDFSEIISYLTKEFGLNVNLIENPDLNEIIKNKETPSLYFMFGEKYKNKYVSFKDEKGGDKKISDVITPYLNEKMYELNYQDFIQKIALFDIYSQVKLYNIYANNNGYDPIVSQGIILSKQDVFKKSLAHITKVRLVVDGKKKKSPTYPSKSSSSKIKKVISELDIKQNIYVNKVFKFKTDFPNFDTLKIENIKLINMLSKKRDVIYSFVQLDKIKDDDFHISESKLFVNEQINKLSLAINWKQELVLSDSIIIVNDTYLMRVKDNDLMPTIIIEKNKIGDSNKDICFEIEEKILSGKSLTESVKKPSGMEKNKYYPYNLPTAGKMVGVKNVYENSSEGYSNCLFNLMGNELTAFMTLRDQALNSTMAKNNRLESIGLFEFKDFVYKKIDWGKNEQLLCFYLHSIPFNYIVSGAITKKSMLTKIGDVLLVN